MRPEPSPTTALNKGEMEQTMKQITAFTKQMAMFTVTILLAAWPPMVHAEGFGDNTMALHPDAYWYNNEDHGNFIPGSTPSAVIETTVQSKEAANTALALHPDAYWYNNEDHGNFTQGSTLPKGLTAQAPAR